jgi:hypothetical protein
MGRKIAAVLAIVGWFSLILQFVLHMTNPVVPEPGTAERFVRFFSYFTISTNIIVAATLTAIALAPLTKVGKFFSRPSVQAAVASYISIVGIVYSLFLRSVWEPHGWNAVADHLLHDLMPLAFVIYWLFFSSKNGIGWGDPFKWLIYPLVYIGYSLIRGAIVMWYPYWFVDVVQLGYTTALMNTVFVLIAFVMVGFIYAGIARLMTRPAASA